MTANQRAAKPARAKKQQSLQAAIVAALHRAIDNGWSHTQLGKAMGVPQPTISRLLSGVHSRLNEETMQSVCSFFGMQLTKPRKNLTPPKK